MKRLRCLSGNIRTNRWQGEDATREAFQTTPNFYGKVWMDNDWKSEFKTCRHLIMKVLADEI